MGGCRSLSHSRYDCKYHVVFAPKMRRKKLYGKVREYLKKVFPELARQKSSRIIAGYMAQDHVYRDTAEICDSRGSRIFEREECDSGGAAIWEAGEFFRRTFVGQRLGGVHSRV